MKLVFSLIILFCSSIGWSYTAKNSTEAILTYQHWVELSRGHSMGAAKSAIRDQIAHLFGPMSMGPVFAAPKENEIIPDSSIEIARRNDGVYVARYLYRGTLVLKNGPQTSIKVALPNDPYTIWQTSVDNSGGRLNPCTDEHYQAESDFWYFWNPARPNCSKVLKAGRDFNYVVGHIQRKPNLTSTYPEYKNLPDKNGRIQITLIMGKDVPSRIRSPYNRKKKSSDDENAKNYRLIAQKLVNMGFKPHHWSNEEVKKIVREPLSPYPFVTDFTFNYNNDRASQVVVQMVYTNVDVVSQSNGFYYFLEYALEKSAVTIYDGHSGLGGNIDLATIRQAVRNKFRFNFNKSKYQIYFFNSCSSYAYYNEEFFAKKGGTKYLDVLTAGLESAFDGSPEVNLSLIYAIHTWALSNKQYSYQQLAAKMENDNLFGVNGDEDNPTTPK